MDDLQQEMHTVNEELAIECRNVYKHYGSGKNKLEVLQGLNMTVPRGAIYGLLGPSGCGKTTLLRCVLGRLKFDKGSVITCGKPPNTAGHGIPGRMVGYMPQETALFGEFTIGETLNYFGTLHRMFGKELAERKQFLLDLLMLPAARSIVGNLSGGQMRRVSFACALLQKPELLILDEPTVGVDPVLRMKIWEYLLQFANEGSTTIILTTHYIEEARQANMVGLMRNGKLLSESPPQELMDYHQMQTLEDVFLKLCMQDGTEDDVEVKAVDTAETNPIIQPEIMADQQHVDDPSGTRQLLTGPKYETFETKSRSSTQTSYINPDPPKLKISDMLPSIYNMWALILKGIIRMARNPGQVIFQFLIPAIQVILFCLCIGGDPKNLKVAVVNEDTGFLFQKFGEQFLADVDPKVIHQVPIDNLTVALDDAKAGKYWGAMYLGPDYSKDLVFRFAQTTNVTNDTIEGSSVHLYLDMSNAQISLVIQQQVLEAFETFIDEVLTKLKMNPLIASIPVIIEDPIYGSANDDLTNFMAPGVILSIIFFLALGLTALTFVIERKEGLLDRTWVAGVSATELMLAHVCTQTLIMIVQIALVMIFMFTVFHIPSRGSLALVVVMTLLQGLCGMAYGLLISALVDDEMSAMQFALGSFYPVLLLSGIIWPIQAMPKGLSYISVILPQTYASEALRAILFRGWGLSYFTVWIGYVVTIGWSIVLLILSAIILKLRR
ncbi:ABC transporter G family member 20-like [Amphiura filiformis]|uniref:ABC transporter G family member 20-like n=1 Tax=Amphiura filiformis TaxID=82378 RepID=UPI003B21D349